jgi:hypothetical protein
VVDHLELLDRIARWGSKRVAAFLAATLLLTTFVGTWILVVSVAQIDPILAVGSLAATNGLWRGNLAVRRYFSALRARRAKTVAERDG